MPLFPAVMTRPVAEEKWKLVKKAFVAILEKNATLLSFENLYSTVYQIVLNKHGDLVYDDLIELIRAYLQESRAMWNVRDCDGSSFLEMIQIRWKDHTVATAMIRDLTMYLKRVNHGRTGVYEAGLRAFHEEILLNEGILERLRSILLTMIEAERRGEATDRTVISSATKMLRDLSVYRSEFEVHFISATSQFYHEESRQHLQDHNASIYLRMVQKIIVEESLRAERYLDPTTKEILLDVLDDELLSAHKTTILEMEGSGIAAMLGGKKTEDLKLLYALFGRIEDGVKLMAEHVSRYVRSQGAEAVNALGETAETPSHFVNTISKLKQVVDDLVREAFDSDELVKSKVRNDFEHIMNLKERSPEYLSRFIDHLLCSGHSRMFDAQVEETLNMCISLFRFLSEKDLFERWFKHHLARRLLQDKTGNEDAERSILLKLKVECGSAFTAGLEGMFKDISVSQDTMNLFRDYLCRREPRSKDIGLSVKVVAGVNWPVSAAPKPCTLPPTLSNAFQEFKAFYQKQHRGRTLMLNPVWGHVDLKATFFGGRKARGQQEVCASQARNMKMLQVSTYQALILLRFNHKPTHTYRELLDETAIPEEDLKRCLVSLSYSSRGISCVLLRPNDQGAEIGLDEEFTVNDGYSSARSKINLCVLLKNEGEPSIKETRAKTERDRKHEVEAAIVRVMKARQEMPHAHLTAEVTNHLKARFLPSPQMIKERVESLIERDYLGRDTKDRRIIKYMS